MERLGVLEDILHSLNCLLLHPLKDMAVDRECEGHVAVTEHLGDDLGVDVLGEQEGSAGVPKIVEANFWEIMFGQDLPQSVQDGRPLGSGFPVNVGEDQTVISEPGSLLFVLAGFVSFQSLYSNLGESYRSSAFGGLRGIEYHPNIRLRERSYHV